MLWKRKHGCKESRAVLGIKTKAAGVGARIAENCRGCLTLGRSRRGIRVETFWSKVYKTDDCWFWIGAISSHGYGAFKYEGRIWRAHILSWTMQNGPVPDGLELLHACDIRNCVRVDHMKAAVHVENMRDAVSKGTVFLPEINTNTDAFVCGHPRTVENTRMALRASGSRLAACRICIRSRKRRYRLCRVA